MRIFLAGDSTVQYNDDTTFPQTGMGQMLERFFNKAECEGNDLPDFAHKEFEFINCARNGRSTKSFIAEGRLDYIDKNIASGDYLFVIFGHNDEKTNDPARGTYPGGDFEKYLAKFAEVAKKHGAYIVYFTPIARRKFEADSTGKMVAVETHGEYSKAIIDFAASVGAPCIDLSTLTRNYLTKIGVEKSRKFYMNFDAGEYENYPDGKDDNTHLRPEGAFAYAKIIAQEIETLLKSGYC